MSVQYLDGGCLVYKYDCGKLEVGKPFKKLVPVFSTPSEYIHHYRITDPEAKSRIASSTFTSVFRQSPLNDQQYYEWVQSSPTNPRVTGLSHLVGTNQVGLGSVQLSFKVEWSAKALVTNKCADKCTGTAKVVVPVRGERIGHEPWDIKGNRICIPLPDVEGESTKGCFVIPGQYWRFLIYAPSRLSDIEMSMKVTGFVNPPDVYGTPGGSPAMFYVKTPCGKLLAYTNTLGDGQLVTRVASSELETLSRLVREVYTSKTYFDIISISTEASKFDPDLTTETVLTYTSSYKCTGDDCVQSGSALYDPSNAIGAEGAIFYVGALNSGYTACGFYSYPKITKVDPLGENSGRFVQATVGDSNFILATGTYQVKMMIEGEDGKGISWNNAVLYSDDTTLVYGGTTRTEKECFGGVDTYRNFNLIMYDGNSAVPYIASESNPAPSTDGYEDNGDINMEMIPGPDVNSSSSPSTFTAPSIDKSKTGFGNQYSYVFYNSSFSTEYYILLGACVTLMSTSVPGGILNCFSPLSDYKVHVQLIKSKTPTDQ